MFLVLFVVLGGNEMIRIIVVLDGLINPLLIFFRLLVLQLLILFMGYFVHLFLNIFSNFHYCKP